MAQPDTPERLRDELEILMSLGPALIAARGFGVPEVEHTYTRARELAKQTGQSDLLFHATWGQWVHYNQVCDFETAQELVEQLFQQAEQSGDEGLLLEAHHSGWTTEWARGDAASAEEHTKKGLMIHRPELHNAHIQLYGHDPKSCAISINVAILWMLGYPDQAKQRALEGLVFSKGIAHPFSSAFARWGVMFIKLYRGELTDAADEIERFLAFVEEQRFPLFITMANLFQGAALTRQGIGVAGMDKIHEVQSMIKRIGAFILWSWALSEYLRACLATGAVEEGLQAVKREKDTHPLTGQRSMEPEIRRLHGELILADDPERAAEAEAEFHLAIEIAQRQSTKSLELRVAMSLARLWQKQGKIKETRERLSKIYSWFTEGFDTADLKEAKALLDELGG